MQPQALIRTYVPIIVGYFLAWLASYGIHVDTATQVSLVSALGGLFSAVYYTLAHWLESRWPVFSVLLGSTAKPTYQTAVPSGTSTFATSEPNDAPETLE